MEKVIDVLLGLQQKIIKRMELVKVNREEYDISDITQWSIGYTFALKREYDFLAELKREISKQLEKL